MNMLRGKSWAALSGCNTKLRQAIHSCATAVLIRDQNDLQTIFKGYWPQLAVIMLRKQSFEWSVSWTHGNNLRVVALLDLTQSHYWHKKIKCSVLLVAPQAHQQLQAGMAYNSRFASAASAYLSPRCMDVSVLHLRRIHNTQGIAQLRFINWRNLTHLNLSNSKLEAPDMTYLISASMLQLRKLSLSYNLLTSEDIKILVSGHLPKLKDLDLYNVQLDAAAAHQLVKSDWPKLERLDLSGNMLNDMAMLHLADGQWPKLKQLVVAINPMGALGLQRLTKGRWPELCRLAVDSAVMCPATLGLLDIHTMPRMEGAPHSELVAASRNIACHEPNESVIWPSLYAVHCWSGCWLK